MVKTEPTCCDCKWWKKTPSPPGARLIQVLPVGDCYGAPPTPIALASQQGLTIQPMRPVMTADAEICGAFRPTDRQPVS